MRSFILFAFVVYVAAAPQLSNLFPAAAANSVAAPVASQIVPSVATQAVSPAVGTEAVAPAVATQAATVPAVASMPAAVSPAVATTAGAPQVVGTQVAQTMVLPSLFANLAPTSTAAAFGLVIPTPSAAASMQPASASGAMPVSSASQTVAAPFALPTLAFPSALPAISFPSISLPSGLPVLGAVQPASSATASPVAVTPATA